ncbi:MAG: thiaminase II [Rhodospirillales bacterium]|nr:thiaminase II [Rhodospirillales bacterium]
MTLFAELRHACADEWARYVDHPFVRGLADGTLPESCFRHYLVQDYLFLIHFARAYGLAVFKSDNLNDIRQAAAGLSAIVDQEMQLHVAFCRRWALDEDDMAAAPEADATMAYTRYVLEKGLSGDLLDLQTALAPCIVGYGEIGQRLFDNPATRMEGNPYREWIETYAAEEYQAVAAAHVAHMDSLMVRRGGPGRLPSLTTTFRQATRLEASFWDMGLCPPMTSS